MLLLSAFIYSRYLCCKNPLQKFVITCFYDQLLLSLVVKDESKV